MSFRISSFDNSVWKRPGVSNTTSCLPNRSAVAYCVCFVTDDADTLVSNSREPISLFPVVLLPTLVLPISTIRISLSRSTIKIQK